MLKAFDHDINLNTVSNTIDLFCKIAMPKMRAQPFLLTSSDLHFFTN